MNCTKSDTCAEEEYRERDSLCEVKLRLLTAAAAAAACCYVQNMTVLLFFFFLSSTKRNTQRCILISSTTLPSPRSLAFCLEKSSVNGIHDPAIVGSYCETQLSRGTTLFAQQKGSLED